MLLQTLLLVATLTVLGGSLLASTLVSVKAAEHAKVMRASESAMNDATADFVAWAQTNVRVNGIEQLPVWSATPQAIGPSSACVEPAASLGATAAEPCTLFETIRWNVTGYSGSPSASNSSSSPSASSSSNASNASSSSNATSAESLAMGLASSQDEQRVSATITVSITDANQSVEYATRSRELTARIFHSAPYVAVTGARDAASQDGAISSAEGDTAGYEAEKRTTAEAVTTPDPSRPAGYADTVIKTTVDCVNTANNASRDALADNDNVPYVQLRNYGNVAWVYETPCKPIQRVNPATAPVGYEAPLDNVYGNQSTVDSNWAKNDENRTSFAW